MPRKGKGQKVKAASGQTYGKRVAQEEAQRVIPLPTQPTVRPGGSGAFTRPTERPGEPVTAGAPVGAGVGPEAVRRPVGGGGDVLSQRLAEFVPILETAAAQPGASANFRMFVRRVRLQAAKSPLGF